ncbi:hypothetical protein EIK76_03370 [Rheinheimera mesophila]|uniref:4-alpha-L-fucosyltransferase n=1 Tax=Rheinheimera mesophila TaxID=1547515 RepID=A0A3P3QQW9_9GAMM|nr:TDP-N-acetylfucosamine:lipid II N-acetylfucosaminyltransferase [Rheinheimera mesophila]KKL00432.1 hypothetical protein SD53_14865 [Rheinheimera mesophila]RRJ23138.1 hypothetical protein EIK76_03370 [Rheinheimera mesophila]
MTKKILHIASSTKFIFPFINLVNERFSPVDHEFLLTTDLAEDEVVYSENVKLFLVNTLFLRIKYHLVLVMKMHQADRVLLHGLFSFRLVQILFFTPWLLKKCYWIIWGGDLYSRGVGVKNWRWKIREFFRGSVIRNMGHLVTYIRGDVELARDWYSAKGQYHECLMYQSNLYKFYEIPEKNRSVINIQIGNSADPTNNHIDVFEKLLPFKDDAICIYVPLSYGSKLYAEKVIALGTELFGDKFRPITEIMSFDNYLEFLGSIDIAIFNHKRQQAMGNTITLLGLGKTVYLRSDTTQWALFKEKNITVRDVVDFKELDFCFNKHNVDMVEKYFSMENYHRQLDSLFD